MIVEEDKNRATASRGPLGHSWHFLEPRNSAASGTESQEFQSVQVSGRTAGSPQGDGHPNHNVNNEDRRDGLALQYPQSSFAGHITSWFPTHNARKLRKDFLLDTESEQRQTRTQRILHPTQRETQPLTVSGIPSVNPGFELGCSFSSPLSLDLLN